MRIVFLGATKFSEALLKTLLDNKFDVSCVFGIPKNFQIKKKIENASKQYENSNFSDLEIMARQKNIPFYEVGGGEQNLSSYYDVIQAIKPDVILVLGWYYIVPRKIRELARLGAYGIHASLLPKYAGGSPLVWALIHGEKVTGITLFKIDEGVDDGDILGQVTIDIDDEDTIGSLYDKVIQDSKKLLVSELKLLENGQAILKAQDKKLIVPWPIRTPEDGLINWNLSTSEIYNFVRAQTKPYPCAFSFLEHKKIKFISVKKYDFFEKQSLAQPGDVILDGHEYIIKTKDSYIKPDLIEVDEVEVEFSQYCQEHMKIPFHFESKS